MHSEDMESAAASCRGFLSAFEHDPLDADSPDDARLTVTSRELVRVALVATETASRFAREGIDTDPMAWLLAPRRLFDGRAALDACLARDECLRAVLLHGLSIGMDADPEDITDLLEESDDVDLEANPGEEDGAVVKGAPLEVSERSLRFWASCVGSARRAAPPRAREAWTEEESSGTGECLPHESDQALGVRFQYNDVFDAALRLGAARTFPTWADPLGSIAKGPASTVGTRRVRSVQQGLPA